MAWNIFSSRGSPDNSLSMIVSEWQVAMAVSRAPKGKHLPSYTRSWKLSNTETWLQVATLSNFCQSWTIKMPTPSLLSPGQTVLPTQGNSSQVTIGGWPNGASNSIQLARKPFSCLTTTAQSPGNTNNLARVGESWPRWPNGGKLGSS